MGTGHIKYLIINELSQKYALFLPLERNFYRQNQCSREFQINATGECNDVFLDAPYCPEKAYYKAFFVPKF